MLTFADPPLPNQLVTELEGELFDYAEWRSRRRASTASLSESLSSCALHEVIPYLRIPRDVVLGEGSINDQLVAAGWHLQIHCSGRPRYYSRAFFGESWKIDWIGEAWLADDIARGIRWLDERENDFPDSSVQLLSSRIYQFSSFVIDALEGRHVVVSASRPLRGAIPMFQLLTQSELAARLLEHYGEDYARGGLRR